MTTLIVWLLISVSDGNYNRGTVTTIATLPSGDVCAKAKSSLNGQVGRYPAFYLACVPTEIVVVE